MASGSSAPTTSGSFRLRTETADVTARVDYRLGRAGLPFHNPYAPDGDLYGGDALGCVREIVAEPALTDTATRTNRIWVRCRSRKRRICSTVARKEWKILVVPTGIEFDPGTDTRAREDQRK